tara:strand:- start:16863 stop:17105 length:243 start_codon:yes stop_codon:yes gene_type:complete
MANKIYNHEGVRYDVSLLPLEKQNIFDALHLAEQDMQQTKVKGIVATAAVMKLYDSMNESLTDYEDAVITIEEEDSLGNR